MAVTILLGKLLLCSSNCKLICGTPHWYDQLRSCTWQTRAGVSGDVNKTFECVTLTDSEFYNIVMLWVTPKSTSIKWVTIWIEQLDFCLHRCKWELPDQPPELFFNILIFSTVCSHHMSRWLPCMLKVARSFPCCGWSCTDLYYARGVHGVLPMRWGCDQSIGSIVSDAIVRSWLWSTVTRSSHWVTSVDYCKLLIIDSTFCGSIFSTGWLLALENFTFR